MDDIFEKEGEVIIEAEKLLQSNVFSSISDGDQYGKLLDEYKKLLKQMRRMVKMSDMMQSKLTSLTSELEKLSKIDDLTNLYNRRFFNEIYEKEWYKAVNNQSPLGMLMIDIDYFKKYNDTFGHLKGDKCLQKIASTIEKTVKDPHNFIARFGGEEFVVLMLESTFNHCTEIAQKILENISSGSIVTVSIGIGYMTPKKDMEWETLLNEADQALYRAKKDGRSCYRS